MTEKAKSGAVYDDVVSAPDEKIAEIVGGDLYLSPRPALRHGHVATALGAEIHDAFERGRSGPGGWWILFEPELHLLGDVLVPDLAGWRRERLPAIPDLPAMALSPDWICEVVSPSTARFDRIQKMPRYALAEIGHLWIADPSNRRLEIYGRMASEWLLLEIHDREGVVFAPPFEAAGIDLARLWN